jgi:hypothetical protein
MRRAASGEAFGLKPTSGFPHRHRGLDGSLISGLRSGRTARRAETPESPTHCPLEWGGSAPAGHAQLP